jgi:Lipase (class 3)
MTTSKDLLLAILAMDSYNQGYGAGLITGATKIGRATLKDNPASLDDSTWQSTGFYAAAYTTPDGIVISYRGTDVLNPLNSANDIINGWVSATGTVTTQATLSLDFYKAVTGGVSVFDTSQPPITLTGHSLGGGLAGIVSSLSGNQAVVFELR